MDFITGLPKHNGKNALMVCCDKLGKLSHLVPTWVGGNHLSAPEVANLFFANWVWYYGVPKRLIHNHDVRLTASFWHALWAMLGTQIYLVVHITRKLMGRNVRVECQNHTIE